MLSRNWWFDRGAVKAPWLTIIIGILVFGTYIFHGPAPEGLVWNKSMYIHSPWRLVTAHFTHCDLQHILWNLPPFLIQGWLLERYSKKAILLGVGAGVAGVDIFLLFIPGAPDIYCGLSGLLNAMLVTNVFYIWMETGYHPVILIVVADLVKISAEISNNGALISSASWPSAPQAHAFGFITAALVCGLLWRLDIPGKTGGARCEAQTA